MFKLRFSKPRYSVKNKNGKMVTYCTFMCTLFNDGKSCDVQRFTASTTCSENDTYSPIEGRHLAESKCKVLAYKAARNRFKKVTENFKNDYEEADKFYKHMEHMTSSEMEHVSYLMNRGA